MALWQYTFQILPKESYSTLSKDLKFNRMDGFFDEEPFWKYKLIDKKIFESMERILSFSPSWSKEIITYGDSESNCLEIYFDLNNDSIKSVCFRIDFTTDFEKILQKLINFCLMNQFILLDEKFEPISLDFKSIMKIIEKCQQLKKYQRLIK